MGSRVFAEDGMTGLPERLREQILIDYAPLVRWLAVSLGKRLPASVDVDDLVSEGMMGLLEAVDRFDPRRENTFKTFASRRIRGRMLDYLRAMDPLSRNQREQVKAVERQRSAMEQQLGREVGVWEAVMSLGWSEETRRDVGRLSGEGAGVGGHEEEGPWEALARQDYGQRLAAVLETLKDAPKIVCRLYYFEEMTLREIGVVLGCSESRVSQIHRGALECLRELKVTSGS